MHLLMLGTLRPLLFFGWIVGLVTTITVAFPFGTAAALDAKIATAIVSLAIGVATGTLIGGGASSRGKGGGGIWGGPRTPRPPQNTARVPGYPPPPPHPPQ